MQRIDRLRTLTKQEIQKVRFVFAPTHPVLAALDYRSNDLFRYTFGSEDQLSNKILIAFSIGFARHSDCPAEDPGE